MGVAPVRIAAPLCHTIRQVSTAPSRKAQMAKKPTKAAIPAKEKTKTPSTAATQPKKPSTKATTAGPEQPVPIMRVPTAKTTRAPESTDAATSVKNPNSAPPATSSEWSNPAMFTKATTASSTLNASATPRADGARPKVDPSSPEYKKAARKWVSTMIALPVLIVTSYFLFDRLVSGNNPNSEAYPSRPRTSPAAKDA